MGSEVHQVLESLNVNTVGCPQDVPFVLGVHREKNPTL